MTTALISENTLQEGKEHPTVWASTPHRSALTTFCFGCRATKQCAKKRSRSRWEVMSSVSSTFSHPHGSSIGSSLTPWISTNSRININKHRRQPTSRHKIRGAGAEVWVVLRTMRRHQCSGVWAAPRVLRAARLLVRHPLLRRDTGRREAMEGGVADCLRRNINLLLLLMRPLVMVGPRAWPLLRTNRQRGVRDELPALASCCCLLLLPLLHGLYPVCVGDGEKESNGLRDSPRTLALVWWCTSNFVYQQCKRFSVSRRWRLTRPNTHATPRMSACVSKTRE